MCEKILINFVFRPVLPLHSNTNSNANSNTLFANRWRSILYWDCWGYSFWIQTLIGVRNTVSVPWVWRRFERCIVGVVVNNAKSDLFPYVLETFLENHGRGRRIITFGTSAGVGTAPKNCTLFYGFLGIWCDQFTPISFFCDGYQPQVSRCGKYTYWGALAMGPWGFACGFFPVVF